MLKVRANTIARYLTIFLCLILLRVTDLYLTFRITPDLSLEWNPLISYFNLTWSGFITVQSFLIALAMFGYHQYAQRLRNIVDRRGLSLPRFVFYYFNGHDLTRQSWTRSFARLPSKHHFRSNGAFIGFVIVSGFMLVSIFAIIHNMLILNQNLTYLEFVGQYNHIYFPIVFSSLVISSANVFFVREYAEYKAAEKRID